MKRCFFVLFLLALSVVGCVKTNSQTISSTNSVEISKANLNGASYTVRPSNQRIIVDLNKSSAMYYVSVNHEAGKEHQVRLWLDGKAIKINNKAVLLRNGCGALVEGEKLRQLTMVQRRVKEFTHWWGKRGDTPGCLSKRAPKIRL